MCYTAVERRVKIIHASFHRPSVIPTGTCHILMQGLEATAKLLDLVLKQTNGSYAAIAGLLMSLISLLPSYGTFFFIIANMIRINLQLNNINDCFFFNGLSFRVV
jgi:hypothetical protein